jgi:hypothetical protein
MTETPIPPTPTPLPSTPTPMPTYIWETPTPYAVPTNPFSEAVGDVIPDAQVIIYDMTDSAVSFYNTFRTQWDVVVMVSIALILIMMFFSLKNKFMKGL